MARGRGNKEKVCPDGGTALAKHILSTLYAQGLLYPAVLAKEGKREERRGSTEGQGRGKPHGNFPVTFVPSEHSLTGTIKYDDANFLPLANSSGSKK